MAVAGTLKAIFTADTAQFKSGLASARNDLNKFGADTRAGAGVLGKFKSEMLTSRASLQAFAAATGASARELHHLVSAIEIAGPVGVAIGAIMIMKAAMDDLVESQKRAIEQNAKWLDGLKESRLKMEGMKLSPAGERVKESGQRVKEMTQRRNEIIDESRNGFEALGFHIKNYFSGGNLGQERINELNEIKAAMQRERENNKRVAGMSLMERASGVGSGTASEQQLGQDVGAFKIEHGENEQIDLLRQIAENTGQKGSPPVSHFHKQ